MTEFRIEHDSMGEVRVPADAKWAAQTQRAVANFPISGLRIERALIGALAAIKGAAALENARLKVLDRRIATGIDDVAAEVAAGKWDGEFPIDVYQTGSGTSSNMNMNEVLATLASERLGEPVHPNDHVNASQSSNDVFPSAIHLAATREIVKELIPALEHLSRALRKKSRVRSSAVMRQLSSTAWSGSRRPSPGSASCRSAALLWVQGSTCRRASPARLSNGWPQAWSCP